MLVLNFWSLSIQPKVITYFVKIMKPQSIFLTIFSFLFFAANALAQPVKCIDLRGKVVYSNIYCPENTKLEKTVSPPNVVNLGISKPSMQIYTPPPKPLSQYNQSPFPNTHEPNTNYQLELEELKSRQTQIELDKENTDQALEEARLEAEEKIETERQDAEDRARETEKKTAQAAEDFHYETLRSSIKIKNNIYFGAVLLTMGVFVIYLIMKNKKGIPMNENQKYGVVTIIVSFLLILLALMISEGWNLQLDYLENLMNNLRIELIEHKNEDYNPNSSFSSMYAYLIDWPTKYVILALLTSASYGLTTYLGITPTFTQWKKTKGYEIVCERLFCRQQPPL